MEIARKWKYHAKCEKGQCAFGQSGRILAGQVIFWIALWKALRHWKQKHDPQPSVTSYLRGLLLPRQSCQFPAHQSIYQVTINEKLSLGKKPTATSTLLVTGKRAHVSLWRRKRATWLPQLPVDTDTEQPRSWWMYQKLQKLCRSKPVCFWF